MVADDVSLCRSRFGIGIDMKSHSHGTTALPPGTQSAPGHDGRGVVASRPLRITLP